MKKSATEKKHQLVIHKGNKCHDCGNSFPDCCYDFDHREPALKSFAISRRYGSPLQDLIAEADKCDLVCANCHRIRTTGNEEIALKLSAAGQGNKNGLGNKHRPETLAQMSASHMGHGVSTETRQKLSVAHKGKSYHSLSVEARRKVSEALRLRVITDETRRRISEAKKGKGKPWSEARRIAYEATKEISACQKLSQSPQLMS